MLLWTLSQNLPRDGQPPTAPNWRAKHRIWDARPLEIDVSSAEIREALWDGQPMLEQKLVMTNRKVEVEIVLEQTDTSRSAGERLAYLELLFDPPGTERLPQPGYSCLLFLPCHRKLPLPDKLQPGHEYTVRIYVKIERPQQYDHELQEVPYRYALLGRGHLRVE